MPTYRHTQPGWLVVVALGGCCLLSGGIALSMGASDSETWIPGMMAMIFATCIVLFYALTVTVSEDRIALHFGIGVIGKSFATREVRRVSIVRNHWYYGWGIRYTPHGWLFNVAGFDAVEIELHTGRKYRIGTDDPEQLHDAINELIHEAIDKES